MNLSHTIVPEKLPPPPPINNTMPIQEQFGMHVKRRRKILRLSQTKLGQLTDTSQTAIARLEAGAGNPSVGLLQRVASALELECALFIRPRR